MKLASRDIDDDLGSGSEGLGDFVKNEESSNIASVEHLTKPPPERDFEFFRNVGLSNNGNNPHHLKEQKHIPTAEIEKVFGSWQNVRGW
jgi:hypothetical protein